MQKITRFILSLAAVVAFSSLANAFPIWNGSGSGGGGGGVSSLNTLTGALSLTSTGSTITITPSGSSINLEASASAPTFNLIGSGTNTTAAMLVGTGATLGVTGSGTIVATSAPASGLTGTTLASGVTGSSLTSVGTLVNLTVTNPISGSVTGNAGTATTLATGRTLSITGDLAYTSPSFNGSANVSAAGTLATVNSNVGTYAGITINGKGLNTAAIQITPHDAVRIACTSPLTATYSNGTAGVGATLTNATTQAAFACDSTTANTGDPVIIEAQASTFQNGIYVVTTPGTGSTNWVLTRRSDFDNSTPLSIREGDSVAVSEGTANAGAIFIENGAGPWTIGTTAITFEQNSAGSIAGGYAASVSNSDGTLTISPTTGAVVASLNTAHSNTWTAAQTNSTSGASSASADNLTGTPFIGSGTTSTPLFYFNDAVTQPTTWNSTASTGGTYLGFNALTGFTGNIIDVHVNGGVSLFSVTGAGSVTAGGSISGTNLLGTALVRSTSAAGASTAVFTAQGALFTGGSGTTTFPQWFAQPSAATAVTTWSTSGTVFGANEASGFAGNFLDLHVNGGASVLSVNASGAIVSAGAATFAGRINSTLSAGTNTSAFLANGILATGGSGTTNFPQYFAQSAGSAVTTWSTAGTYFGVNALSSFTGNFEDYHVNGGTSVWNVTSTGAAVSASSLTEVGLINTGVNTGLINVATTTFTSTVTPVGSNSFNVFNFGTQTGNVTVAAPSGTSVDGNELDIRFVIDATGGYTTTFNAIYAFGTDVTAALIPTAANSKFELKFMYNATDSKWRAVAIARGF